MRKENHKSHILHSLRCGYNTYFFFTQLKKKTKMALLTMRQLFERAVHQGFYFIFV